MTDVKPTRLERLRAWLFGFEVICDERNNTPRDVEEGRVNINVILPIPKLRVKEPDD